MTVSLRHRRAALKSRTPWRFNPMCVTPRSIAVFAEYERNPNARRRERIAERDIDNTDPPETNPESDLYRGP